MILPFTAVLEAQAGLLRRQPGRYASDRFCGRMIRASCSGFILAASFYCRSAPSRTTATSIIRGMASRKVFQLDVYRFFDALVGLVSK
jgi:hypothetical protein